MKKKDEIELRRNIRAYVVACGGDPDAGSPLNKEVILDGTFSSIDEMMRSFSRFMIGFASINKSDEYLFNSFTNGGDA